MRTVFGSGGDSDEAEVGQQHEVRGAANDTIHNTGTDNEVDETANILFIGLVTHSSAIRSRVPVA